MINDAKFYIANEDGMFEPLSNRIETMEISYTDEDGVTTCFESLGDISELASATFVRLLNAAVFATAKNKRVRHLAIYSKKKRIRKKNTSRAIKNLWKQGE